MILFGCLAMIAGRANNVVISNVSTVTSATFTQVEFDISWDNSWRVSSGPSNYDAVWVFIKYKVGNEWFHLNLTGSNNSIGAGYTITVPSDLKGAFIYRSSDGSGTVTLTDVRVGVAVVSGTFDIRMFGVEMVFIPQGNFYIGDGNGTTESTNAFHNGTGNSQVQITSLLVSDIRVDANTYDDTQIEGTGIGIDGDGGLDTDDNGSVDNALFPTGYLAFYCMKYELSQGAYRDFLNSLTYTQQATLTAIAPNSAVGTSALGGSHRNYIEIATPGSSSSIPAVYGLDADFDNVFDESNDGQWVAAGYQSWPRLCSYLDWAALRPMTELEFEKICRGTNAAILNEYVWGTTSVFASEYVLSNPGQTSEVVSNASSSTGNANYGLTSPGGAAIFRNGIFATGTSGRTASGAAYYGAMELAGNIYDRIVNVGTVAGRSFTGALGDGQLNTSGNADVNYWPGINGNNLAGTANAIYGGTTGVTEAAGSGDRGGSYIESNPRMYISERSAASVSTAGVYVYYGGRGGR